MTLTSGGNLGLGGTPSAWGAGTRALDIGNGSALYNPGSNTQTWLLNNAFNDGVSFKYKNNGAASWFQQDGASSVWHNAPSGTAGDPITFTEKVRIDSDGLKFNGDTAAANALDDYEEGTFTPVLTGSTSGTFNGSGKYTKIGDVVNVFMQFVEITTVNKPIGDYTVTGLPFTSRATMPDATPLTIGALARVTFDASKIQASAINANSTTVVLNELTSDGLVTAFTDANFVNASNMFFRISGSYPTST
jgi:hypothetical protein